MVNISIWSIDYLEIENDQYTIDHKEDLIKVIEEIVKKCRYSGEVICIESVRIVDGQNLFTEINRH